MGLIGVSPWPLPLKWLPLTSLGPPDQSSWGIMFGGGHPTPPPCSRYMSAWRTWTRQPKKKVNGGDMVRLPLSRIVQPTSGPGNVCPPRVQVSLYSGGGGVDSKKGQIPLPKRSKRNIFLPAFGQAILLGGSVLGGVRVAWRGWVTPCSNR